jgi:formylglycine-generating enzyme required for sulfatase activity
MKFFHMSMIVFMLMLTACAPSKEGTRVDDHGVAQVWVPAGSFMMGATEGEQVDPPGFTIAEIDSELPLHEVQITTGFWIDTYEVTIAEFKKFANADGYEKQEYWSDAGWEWLATQSIESLLSRCSYLSEETLPKVCVTWYEAEAYAHWRGGRLPTEAEWEYAARGPQSLVYPWGNEFDETRANTINSPGLKPVGSYPNGISWVGAHDMAGNAMEWVQDWVDFDYYKASPGVDPQGPETGLNKIEKGGWWGGQPYLARAAYHHFTDPPHYQDLHIGFRIVSPAE